MKKHLLLSIAIFLITLITTPAYTQKAVISFKAKYYKDYIYPGTISPGTPDVPPIIIEGVSGAWNGLPPGHTPNWPNNSLTPIEIRTSLGTIVLNGEDPDGTKHNFKGVRVELPPHSSTDSSHNFYLRGTVVGYGGGPTHFNHTSQLNYDWYLTSGIERMDLATGVTNIPKGAELTFGVVLIDKERIADGKPDIIFSQVALPSGPFDKLELLDENDNPIGEVEVNFVSPSIPNLGTERNWDYNKGDNPSVTGDGAKGLKMITFELSDFGINENNYDQVKKIKFSPSGSSDIAFIAADRLSLLAFKKIDGHINIKKNEICKGEPAEISFEAVSENGVGPYEFTYEITDINGTTTTKTVTSTSTGKHAKKTIMIPTENTGDITYKLIKIEDTGVPASDNNRSVTLLDSNEKITITDCDSEYYITTWQTSEDNETITVPTSPTETYKYTIVWEGIDDTSQNGINENNTGDGIISFPKAGRYRVKIRGTFPRIYFNNSGDKDKILTIEQWGTIKWESQENAYYGCRNIRISATDTPDLSNVTSLKGMFKEAYRLDDDISSWDVSSIESMEDMFNNAYSFNQNLANWNMQKVNNINNIFLNSNMSANKLGLTLAGWTNGTNDLNNISTTQTLGANLRYCYNNTDINITNLTMPIKQCATSNEVGNIYLEKTNTGSNHERLAGILSNGAFEWLEENTQINSLTNTPDPGSFEFIESTTQGSFYFNGINLAINKLIFSKNHNLQGFSSLDDYLVYPLTNMKFNYKKTSNEDSFSFSRVEDNLAGIELTEEGVIVYDETTGHFYESVKVDSNNKPDNSGTLKWVQIDN